MSLERTLSLIDAELSRLQQALALLTGDGGTVSLKAQNLNGH